MAMNQGSSGLGDDRSDLDEQNEQRDRRRTVAALRHKLSIFTRLHADQNLKLSTWQKKTKLLQESQNDCGFTKIDSKVKSFFLITTLLKNQFEHFNKSSKSLIKFRDEATFQRAELDDKALELERRISNEEWSSRTQYSTEKINKILPLRKSDQESGAEQIRELILEKDTVQKKDDVDDEEMLKQYSSELNQSTQDFELLETNLKEEIPLNVALNEESENFTSKIEQLDINLQDVLSALNHLKNSSDERSKEHEILFNQASEELKTIEEASQKAEESNRIVREEVNILAISKNQALSEEVSSEEELSKEEAVLNDLQLKKSAAEASRNDLIQEQEELDQQIERFEKEKLGIDHDCKLLEEENACLGEKIQQEVAGYDEVLNNAKVTFEEIASQVANLESELIFANEINGKLNAEVANNASLSTENAETKQKSDSITASEEDLVKKLELSNQNLKNLSDELKSCSEELCIKVEKLSTTATERQAEVDSCKEKHLKLTNENEGRSSLLLSYTERRSDLRSKTDESIRKMVAELQEKEETINQEIAEHNERMEKGKENFKNLHHTFSQKYREKRNRLRTVQVQLANLTEKLEKAKKTNADLHQMLISKLKADSAEADSSTIPSFGAKKIKFSAELEKFSPQLPSGLNQVPKSILKRKNDWNPDESPKKPKMENTGNYFPSLFKD